MHPFCGTPVVPEGYNQPVLCPKCENGEVVKPVSASPIVAAFAKASAQQVPPKNGQRLQRMSESSSITGVPPPLPVIMDDARAPTSRREAQIVSTIKQREKVVRWMVVMEEKSGIKGLFAHAVDEFPEIFRSKTRNANITKTSRWWKKKETLLQLPRGVRELSAKRGQGRSRVSKKALQGRGRQRREWFSLLYPLLLEELDRLRKLGLKFDASMLRQLAIRLLKTSTGPFSRSLVDKVRALIVEKISPRWIQTFMEAHRIVFRTQSGKKQVGPEKREAIERDLAAHLGKLKRGFESGHLNEDAIENVDETHYVIDFDNDKTLGFAGEKSIKYADVVSGGEGMTMVVRISGGASGRIHPPMMIFQNASSSYPIRGVPDKTPGVCYRTGPKGWMSKRVFRQYLGERRAMSADPRGLKKRIYLDNCSSHLDEDECKDELAQLKARLVYLPPNATNLCQPAYSFVIAKIKDACRRKWNEKKIELIEGGDFQNTQRKDGSWSGKLKNPGKKFFLSLAAECVREVNAHRDKNGVNYARKAMIRCGLSREIDGSWSPKQLFPSSPGYNPEVPG
ncbi:hypothetical protein PF010_g14342 [Phytophthora fragariae]|uniref:DDE-1 domain-containing protein n=1 Tax=Phytophthora fragariae TaxID=53985 RepID=A0A6G0KXV4_9STRA|nr:hypothetical protein PF010_g14342 [Phytophthora fragariae]